MANVKKLHQNETLQIRISTDAKEKINEIASSYSMSTSEYLRFLILEDIRKHNLKQGQ